MYFFTKLAKKRSKADKKYHHQVLYIGNNFGTKFRLKVTFLNFWTKLSQRRYFSYTKNIKNENHHKSTY